ncbi:MAG: acyl-CoA dehydratase activase [Nitrospirota bacterium]|nr:acyl-CoA dehydratase activase [Nitrospirota bacterium]
MLTAGVDIGSRSIEVVLYDGGQIVEAITAISGAAPAENAKKAFFDAMLAAGARRSDVVKVIATGYGRNYFREADAVSSEILCHARGVAYVFPQARTVIDIGGQDSKMISVDGNGKVMNFVMNDRCAAGTGKFIEMVGLMLDVPLDNMGQLTENSSEAREISSMCAVFAESEIIGLTQSGTPVDVVLRGVFRSVAKRTLAMTGKVGLQKDVVFTGGVAKNAGVARAIEQETGVRLQIPSDPQVTGALGAALIAYDKMK